MIDAAGLGESTLTTKETYQESGTAFKKFIRATNTTSKNQLKTNFRKKLGGIALKTLGEQVVDTVFDKMELLVKKVSATYWNWALEDF